MCCTLPTLVEYCVVTSLIAVIDIILTGFASLNLVATITTLATGGSTWTIKVVQENVVADIGVQTVIIGVHLVSYILCFIGAIKRNKLLLIPFMILTLLHILLCTLLVIYLIHAYNEVSSKIEFESETNTKTDSSTYFIGLAKLFLLLFIHILAFVIAWLIFSLTVVAKFYNHISNGIVLEQQQGMVLQSYSTPEPVQQGGRVATVYVPVAAQTKLANVNNKLLLTHTRYTIMTISQKCCNTKPFIKPLLCGN